MKVGRSWDSTGHKNIALDMCSVSFMTQNYIHIFALVIKCVYFNFLYILTTEYQEAILLIYLC